MSSGGKNDMTNLPFKSTISVLKSLADVRSLPKFKEALKYAWIKVQIEVSRYWKRRKIDIKKTVLNEDARLMIMAYVLTQAAESLQELVPMLYAV